MTVFLERYIFNNWKIKTYALGVSLVLWFVILGQRSLVVSRSVDVEYLVSPSSILSESVKTVTMTISAKRSVLQSFKAQHSAPVVDLRGLPPGSKRVPISFDSIQLPPGAQLLSIEPKTVTLYLKNRPEKPKKTSSNNEILKSGN